MSDEMYPCSDKADRRAALLREQRELLSALVGSGPAPDGFDPRALGFAATQLRQKRARVLGRAWPGLIQALGDEARALLEEYLAASRESDPIDPHRESLGLARWLEARGKFPRAMSLERAVRELDRGGRVRLVPHPTQDHWVLLIRWPGARISCWTLPGRSRKAGPTPLA